MQELSWHAKDYALLIKPKRTVLLQGMVLARKDVKFVSYSSNGKDYVVHVVDADYDQILENKNTR